MHVEVAVHRFGECQCQRQPDPGSFDAALIRPEALEGNESPLDLFRAQPRTGVGHGHADLIVPSRLACDGDRATAMVVLDRIRRQIDEDLA